MKKVELLFISLISVQSFSACLIASSNTQPDIKKVAQKKRVRQTQSAREYLLSICKKHYENHMQKDRLRNRRLLEASKALQQLNKENNLLLNVLGYRDIVEYCVKNYRK